MVKEGIAQRLADSLETATRVTKGLVKILYQADKREELMSQSYACPDCGVSIGEITPRLFSFNSPYGACPAAPASAYCSKSTSGRSFPIRRSRSRKVRSRSGKKERRTGASSRFTRWRSTTSSSSTRRGRSSRRRRATESFTARTRRSSSSSTGRTARITYNGTYEGIVPMLKRRYLRVRLRRHPRRDRALHDADEVSGVQGPPPQAGSAERDGDR